MGRDKTENIAALFGEGRGQHRYQAAWLPLNLINVLPQPRKTFECIEELALDIAGKGMMNPVIVAAFSREHCEAYLSTINEFWQSSFMVDELVCRLENEESVFYVLLAGERRFRSCLFLYRRGCDECREAYGQEESGVCFQRHFRNSGEIEVRLCVNILPLAAIFLQFSENTHMRVPAHEEAQAYEQLFKLIKKLDPFFSLTKFARCVGRNQSTIRNALKFCELPIFIREAVERGEIKYGIALELSRLAERGIGGEDLRWWTLRARAENYSVEAFRKIVNNFLDNLSSGQLSILDLFDAEAERERRLANIRHAVAGNVIRQLWAYHGYWLSVLRLCRDGLLGRDDAMFSDKSPVRLLCATANLINKEILPYLRNSMPRDAKREIAAAFDELANLLETEIKNLPENN